MERIHYRSTSIVDIQAELRERELLANANARRERAIPRRVTFFRIALPHRRSA